MPRTTLLAALLLLTLHATVATAQDDDAPIPYPDEEDTRPTSEQGLRELPQMSDPSAEFREEAEWEEDESELRLARYDDPNLGLGGELLAGVLLVEASRGSLVDPAFAWGLRFNWEFGRLLAQAPWDEALFADVTWAYGAMRGGTQRVYNDTHYHYFTIAPAYELHVGGGVDYAFYGQLGAGMAYQYSFLHVDGADHTIGSIKPVLQYGVGFRGRPKLMADGNLRLAFRLELTRLRRSYMDDTLIGLTLGTAF